MLYGEQSKRMGKTVLAWAGIKAFALVGHMDLEKAIRAANVDPGLVSAGMFDHVEQELAGGLEQDGANVLRQGNRGHPFLQDDV